MPSDRIPERRDLARMWQATLGRLEVDLPPHTFDTWLRNTRPLRVEGNTIVVEAHRAFDVDHLNERLIVVIERAVYDVTGVEQTVLFVPPSVDAPPTPVAQRPAAVRSVIGSLNCAYTFERYVAAQGNLLAQKSALDILDEEHRAISPLVIYGAPGMGKTHLLHALACSAAASGWSVACLTAEEFTTRYQSSIRRREIDEFHAQVRNVRLLVIDDLQYLAGKRGTQEELAHTIDAVANAGGHVAVGSEVHPYDLDLPERLSSRLTAGIVTHIEPFQRAERRVFVERLARDLRVSLPAWALDRLAAGEVASVRVLQGALHAAVLLARANMLDPRRLDAELMRVALADAVPEACSDRALLEAIAAHFQTTFEDMAGRSRKAHIGQARAVAVAALKERGRSLGEIGRLLGARDRSTISSLATRGRELVDTHPALRNLLAS